jgi:hypothetical protein
MSDIKDLGQEVVNEAYILISAYVREERVAATYDMERLKKVQQFLHDILKDPDSFEPFPKPDDAEASV